MAVIQKNLFEGKNLQPQEILDNLEAISCKRATKTFTMEFDPEEKEQAKEQYFESIAQLDSIEREFSQAKKLYESKKKAIELQIQKSKAEIQNSGYETTEEVYMIDDQEANIMSFVDKRGNVVDSRPLYRDEKQISIKFDKIAANS